MKRKPIPKTFTFGNIGNTVINSYSATVKIVSQSTNSINSKVSSTKYINFKKLLPGQKNIYL